MRSASFKRFGSREIDSMENQSGIRRNVSIETVWKSGLEFAETFPLRIVLDLSKRGF
jgi:hypothetical protein